MRIPVMPLATIRRTVTSTLVAVAPERQAHGVADAMRGTWEQQGVQADSFVNPSQVDGRNLVVHLDCEDAPATAGVAC